MKRVAITGVGVVSPLGNDAPSTWEAAVAGRERHRQHPGLRDDRAPGADRRRGEGLRPERGHLAEGGASASTATSSSRSAPPRRRSATQASTATTRSASGSSSVAASAASTSSCASTRSCATAAPDRVSPNFLPNVLVDSPSGQLAIELGIRGPNYAVVSACATGSHAIGEGAELIRQRRRRRRAGRRDRGLHPPAHPGRLHEHARSRRRERRPHRGLATLRREARGLRHGARARAS